MSGKYDDIIDLEHHKSENYPWMAPEDRAAQFAPFAALVGFEEVIRHTAQEHASRINEKHKSEYDY